jgi:hypothetical protein
LLLRLWDHAYRKEVVGVFVRFSCRSMASLKDTGVNADRFQYSMHGVHAAGRHR